MNLKELQSLDTNFDPKAHKRMPHPKSTVLESSAFASTELHQQAEVVAREAIRSELSKQAGGKPVYSQHEQLSSGRGKKGHEMFEAIAKGEAVIR